MATTEGRKPFEWVGGERCLDFNNTVDWEQLNPAGGDLLPDFGRLVAWSHEAGILSNAARRRLLAAAARRRPAAGRALARAHALRSTIHRIFYAIAGNRPPTEEELKSLNQALAEVPAQVVRRSTTPIFEWAWPTAAGDLTSMLWPVAWSASQLLTSPELARVKTCANERCGWLFIDSSRKHNRKWCQMGVCGNRAKARRFYERQKRRARGAG